MADKMILLHMLERHCLCQVLQSVEALIPVISAAHSAAAISIKEGIFHVKDDLIIKSSLTTIIQTFHSWMVTCPSILMCQTIRSFFVGVRVI